MSKLFGTDGIRGVANREPLTPELALRVGQVLAGRAGRSMPPARIVIGRDTRRSGDLLESALVAGICSGGGEALLAGIVPTPAVAFLVRALGADVGIVVSASHNPYADNGIKLFGNDGFKLPDSLEAEIEAQLISTQPLPRPTAADVGTASRIDGATQRYVDHLWSAIAGGVDLRGRRIVLDCANGAASEAGPLLFNRCGADVTVLFAAPDGVNINAGCGAVHPEQLQAAVRARGAEFGVALDGDADRLILVDETGDVVDGDEILAILAEDRLLRGGPAADAVVATVMSNLGLELCLRQRGIRLIRTAVGDRYVVEAMREQGCVIGGEQSGHVVLIEHATTGDGLLAALSVAAIVTRRACSLSQLRAVMRRLPQSLVNVRVRERRDLDTVDAVRAVVDSVRAALGEDGRVLIRYSGTEPLVRVMVEGLDSASVQQHAESIAAAVRDSLGE